VSWYSTAGLSALELVETTTQGPAIGTQTW
jgi:hypothetical protein